MPAPLTIPSRQIHRPGDWRAQLRDVVTDAGQLLQALRLAPGEAGFSAAAAADFALKVPRAFVARMRTGDARDPLLLQVLAGTAEMLPQPGFVEDPVAETGGANPRPGIIHKYRGRVLLIVSSGCAVHCRYCFRRHFPYADNRIGREHWGDALAKVRQDSSIREVILSGGDPLVATDAQLRELVEEIAKIPHVRRLRVHTRLPVVIPDRVTDELLDTLTDARLRTVLVIHSNHANEIDDEVAGSLAALRARGIDVFNQAVLLRGVNDSVDAQVGLSERLFEAGVLPYYLHLLDRVRGAAHFEVPEHEARTLHSQVRARLPGYLVPALVREEPGADAKVVKG